MRTVFLVGRRDRVSHTVSKKCHKIRAIRVSNLTEYLYEKIEIGAFE